MNGQSHKHSFFESCSNVAIGFGIAVLTQIIVFPLFGIHTKPSSHFGIALIFTVVSLVRSYCLRRLWNGIMIKKGE